MPVYMHSDGAKLGSVLQGCRICSYVIFRDRPLKCARQNLRPSRRFNYQEDSTA